MRKYKDTDIEWLTDWVSRPQNGGDWTEGLPEDDMRGAMKLSLMALSMVAALLLATRGCAGLNSYWYEGYLPQAIETEELLFVEDSGGLREGCGAAIYKMNGLSLERIHEWARCLKRCQAGQAA